MVLKQAYRIKSLYTHSAKIRLDAFFREFRINDDENNVHINSILCSIYEIISRDNFWWLLISNISWIHVVVFSHNTLVLLVRSDTEK